MRNAKTVGAIAAGVLAASALTGVAIAASATADDDTTSQNGSAERSGEHAGPHGGHGPGGHGPGMGGPEGGMLHGEVVVETSEGVYETQQVQRGEATAVSATSITVVSEDGYSATYVISSETESTRDRDEGTAQVGDIVHVMAVVEGATITAERVHAMSPEAAAEMEAHRDEMREWMSDRPEGPRGEGPGRMRGAAGADPATFTS